MQQSGIDNLTQDITWESDKNASNIIEVSPFPAGYNKVTMNRQEDMTNTNISNEKDPQKKRRPGTVSKITFSGGLILVSQPYPQP